MIAIIEPYAILSHAFPRIRVPILARLLPPIASPMITNISVTHSYLLATCLIAFSAALRITCYRTLGRLFTFSLTIRKDHRLVTTGPYAFVRHPAYLGTLALIAGVVLAMFGPGSWLGECVFGQEDVPLWIKVVAIDAGVYVAYGGILVIKRTKREDGALGNEFGKEWKEWASRTRYRLIPLMY